MIWGFDTSVPSVARVYDVLLGGKDNFEADRVAAAKIVEIAPTAMIEARENRAFLARAVNWLATEAGIRQFLDIGSGLPARDNTHEVAQRAAEDTRVMYVDADRVVVTHARALMANEGLGCLNSVHVAEANMLDPAEIIRQAQDILDLTQPVAILLVAILHFISDADDPWGIVKTLMAAVPPGSYLVISHAMVDDNPSSVAAVAALRKLYAQTAAGGLTPRTRGSVLRFLDDGMEMVEPGLVDIAGWHQEQRWVETHFLGGIARKRTVRGDEPA